MDRIAQKTDDNIHFSTTEIIFGTPDNIASIFYLYITIANMHIYAFKFHMFVEPKLEGFVKG